MSGTVSELFEIVPVYPLQSRKFHGIIILSVAIHWEIIGGIRESPGPLYHTERKVFMQNDDYKDDFAPEFDGDAPDDRDAPPDSSANRGGGDPWGSRSQASSGGSGSARQGASARQRSGSAGQKKGGSGNTRKNASGGGKKGKREPVNLKEAPSGRPVHRIVPCLMLAFAVFLFVCMFLNLVSGDKAQSAATHPVGAVGYGICFAFFGLLGGGGFLLPFVLGYLAVMWRRLVDRHRLIEKSVTVTLLQILLSVFIHCCNLGAMEPAKRYMTAAELFETGAKMTGGGFVGGGIAYFLCSRMNVFGAILITVLLLIAGSFILIGMTPQHLVARIRARVLISRAEKRKQDTEEVDRTNIMDRMEKKHDRAAGRRSDPVEDEPTNPPPGAVTYPNGRSAGGRSVVRRDSPLLTEEDNPVPVMPILDASDDVSPDSPLYIPKEIGETLAADSTPQKTPERAEKPASGQKERSAEPAAAPQTAKPTPQTPPAQPRPVQGNPRVPDPQTAALRRAEGAAVDQIFPPQPGDQRNAARRVQKSDQGFELGSIFVAGPDAEIPKERVHVPLPPEVPLPGSVRRTENGAAAPAATPANTAVRPRETTVRLDGSRPAASGERRPAPAGASPAGRQPTFRQATANGPRDFGMTSEELDAKESAALSIDRALSAKKNAARPERTPVKAEPRPVPKPEDRPYTFPPISYLQAGEAITEQTKEELENNAKRITEKMKTFHIDINEITYSCGPTVTRYEVFPASNVRVRTVLGMEKDIALTFGVKDVRMDSMDGKSAIGIEVPNKNRSTVYLRNMMENKTFADNQTPLFCCLGDDVGGEPVYFCIPKMPHLLVAGATNSGKSVCINGIVMSILYKMRPDQVRLIMIDPKKVEFAPYQGIPHLLAPIITTPKDASGALQAAVNEMEARFDRIADVGARNIEGYNKIAATDAGLEPMPLIVIIIDELADLMMVAKNEVEDSICRLLQKARAAGMHLIIGTQRPSVDVITGLLKANIPSRIACTVASVVDSKTILDRGGAEKLLGKGDMLFNPTGAKEPIRVQGAFLSDGEVEKICEFVRATNGTAHYDENFTKLMKEYSAQCGKKGAKEDGELPEGGGDSREDSKYAEAVRIAVESGQISTSMLQRKIGVGYARGAKLVDRMEAEGIVSKQDGAKPREVLMTTEQYISRFIEGNDEE